MQTCWRVLFPDTLLEDAREACDFINSWRVPKRNRSKSKLQTDKLANQTGAGSQAKIFFIKKHKRKKTGEITPSVKGFKSLLFRPEELSSIPSTHNGKS